MVAEHAAKFVNRARGGAKEAMHDFRRLNGVLEFACCRLDELISRKVGLAANDEPDQRGKRRVEVLLAGGQLYGGEAGIVVLDGGLNRVMIGRKRLNQHAAPFIAPA